MIKPTVSIKAKVQEVPQVTKSDDEEFQSALVSTGLAFGSAALFAAGVAVLRSPSDGLDFVSGYVVEDSLSVDNLFVFIAVFDYFKVPEEAQKKVLNWGIGGAVILRGLFIAAGLQALEVFEPLFLAFGGFLLFTSVTLLKGEEDEAEEEDIGENSIVKFSQKLVGKTSSSYDGDNFFTTSAAGERIATPLLLVVVAIELSDVVFAVDSIPAVFGITSDPFIVYTSNVFAILGLRSLYQVLVKAVKQLDYLEPAVALVLGFVGAKLCAQFFGIEVSSAISLGVIFTLLGGGIGLSLASKQGDSDL